MLKVNLHEAKDKTANRRMGKDKGKVSLPSDWDSTETNASVARLFAHPES